LFLFKPSVLPSGTRNIEIKTHNLSAILLTLLYRGGLSRVNIAQSMKVSTATITNLVNELEEQGLVTERGPVEQGDQKGVGRPQKALHLVPEGRLAVGVHLDVGRVYVTLTNIMAQPLQTRTMQHPLDAQWTDVMDEIVDMIHDVIAAQGIDPTKLVGVGVAAPGLVDPYAGIDVFAPNLNWRNVPIKTYLTQRLNLPVIVDNNVRAMALGEAMFGAVRHVRALAFIYARIGVGAGLVFDGQLYRGAAAGAGEIGHTTVVIEGGERCHCGNTGCLETLISEPAIVRMALRLANEHPSGLLSYYLEHGEGSVLDRVFMAVQAGDQEVRKLLEERARYMGVALANLVNVFNPEVIVLGGIFRAEQSVLLPVIEATLRERAFATLGSQVRVQLTSFNDQAGMIGAAALALDSFLYRPQNVDAKRAFVAV
jgi:predicted NBD/HSP70 family sugar kinase